MKKLFALLGLFLFLTTSTYSQEKSIVSGKIVIGEKQFDIPEEVQSKMIFKSNSSDFIKTIRYSESYGGEIMIITDSKNKVVAVVMPPSTPIAKINNPFRCLKSSFWGDGSGWSGFWDCMTH